LGNVIKSRAIILNSIRWKESSKIVTIYGEQTGKIKVIARGALRSNSPFAGKIESLFFVELLIDVKKSRNLQVLKEIDVIDSYQNLRMDIKIFPFALSILEIVYQVFDEGHTDEIFFNFVLEMINSVTESKHPHNVFIYFLLKLSSYLGFKPALDTCTSGDTSLCDERVFLSISQGTIFCKNCFVESINPISLEKNQFFYLKNLQSLNHRRIKSIEISRNDFAQIIQGVLKYINFHFEQNINVNALQMLNK